MRLAVSVRTYSFVVALCAVLCASALLLLPGRALAVESTEATGPVTVATDDQPSESSAVSVAGAAENGAGPVEALGASDASESASSQTKSETAREEGAAGESAASDAASSASVDANASESSSEKADAGQGAASSTVAADAVDVSSDAQSDVPLDEVATVSAASNSDVASSSKVVARSAKVAAAASEQVLESGVYSIHSALDARKVIDVPAASMNDSVQLDLYDQNSTLAQYFRVTYVGDGWYTITNVNSGKSLDVRYGGVSNGTVVQQYASNGTDAQKWKIVTAGSLFELIPYIAQDKRLDVPSGSTANGVGLQIYTANGTPAQRFAFVRQADLSTVDGSAAAYLEDGAFYAIGLTVGSNKVVDIAGGSLADGGRAQSYSSNSTPAQYFRAKSLGGGWYSFVNAKSRKVLEVAGGATGYGGAVQQYASNGTWAQRWLVVKSGSGYKLVPGTNLSMALDVPAASTADGAALQIYAANGTPAQCFLFSKQDDLTSAYRNASVLEDGSWYRIDLGVAVGKVVDIAGGSLADGGRAQSYSSNSTPAQYFRAKSLGGGWYSFVNAKSRKVLEVAGGATGYGGAVQQYASNGTWAQRWLVVKSGSGYKLVPGTNLSMALDVPAASTADGAALQIYAANGTPAQCVSFTKVASPYGNFYLYLDAGHGQGNRSPGVYDSGALGSGYQEHTLTAELAEMVAARLRNAGVMLYLNESGLVSQRMSQAESLGCTALLSIHFNSGGGHGSESYIATTGQHGSPDSPAFQNIMHPYLIQGTGLTDRGKKTAGYMVCKGNIPSVLLEIGFIDSKSDMAKYQARKSTVADRLAEGVIAYAKSLIS